MNNYSELFSMIDSLSGLERRKLLDMTISQINDRNEVARGLSRNDRCPEKEEDKLLAILMKCCLSSDLNATGYATFMMSHAYICALSKLFDDCEPLTLVEKDSVSGIYNINLGDKTFFRGNYRRFICPDYCNDILVNFCQWGCTFKEAIGDMIKETHYSFDDEGMIIGKSITKSFEEIRANGSSAFGCESIVDIKRNPSDPIAYNATYKTNVNGKLVSVHSNQGYLTSSSWFDLTQSDIVNDREYALRTFEKEPITKFLIGTHFPNLAENFTKHISKETNNK